MPSIVNDVVPSTECISLTIGSNDGEQRQKPRFDSADGSRASVRCTLDVDDESLDATLIDVSEGGARLIVSRCLKFAELTRLEIDVSGLGVMLDVAAEVSFVRPLENEEWLISCAFVTEIADDVLDDMANVGIIQRRRRERWEVDIPCVARWELGTSALPATIKDFGVQGFRLIATQPGTIGATVLVSLSESDISPKCDTTFSGNLCWQSERDGAYQLGCATSSSDAYGILRRLSKKTNGKDWRVRFSASRRRVVGFVVVLSAIFLALLFSRQLMTSDHEAEPPHQRLTSGNDAAIPQELEVTMPLGRDGVSAPSEPTVHSRPMAPANGFPAPNPVGTLDEDEAFSSDEYTSKRKQLIQVQPSHVDDISSSILEHESSLAGENGFERAIHDVSEVDSTDVTRSDSISANSKLVDMDSLRSAHRSSQETGSSGQNEQDLSLTAIEHEPDEGVATAPMREDVAAIADLESKAQARSGDPGDSDPKPESVASNDGVRARNSFLRGQSLYRSRQFSAAAGAFAKAVDSDPQQALYRYLLAMAYFELDEHAKADSILEKAITCERTNPISDWGHRMSRFQGNVRQWVEVQRSSRIKSLK